MKILLIILLSCGTALGAANVTNLYAGLNLYAGMDLTSVPGGEATAEPSVVDYWNLEEGSGNSRASTGPAATSMVETDGYVDQSTGINSGYCAEFPGTSSLQATDSAQWNFNSASFTISAWIQPYSLADAIPLLKNDGLAPAFQLPIVSGDWYLQLYQYNGWYGQQSVAGVDTNDFTHHVITGNLSDGKVRWYVNGSVVWTTDELGGGQLLYAETDPLRLSNGSFVGKIDEVRVYNYCLTDGEVEALYYSDSGSSPP